MKTIYKKTLMYEDLKEIFTTAAQEQENGVLVRGCKIICVPKEINSWKSLLEDLPQVRGMIKNSVFIGNFKDK